MCFGMSLQMLSFLGCALQRGLVIVEQNHARSSVLATDVQHETFGPGQRQHSTGLCVGER